MRLLLGLTGGFYQCFRGGAKGVRETKHPILIGCSPREIHAVIHCILKVSAGIKGQTRCIVQGPMLSDQEKHSWGNALLNRVCALARPKVNVARCRETITDVRV